MTQTVLLGDLVRIKGGKRLPKGDVLQETNNSHPYLRIVDMGEKLIGKASLQYVPDKVFPKISRYITNTNDVLLSIVGTIGLVAIVDKELDGASLTENCVKLTCDTEKIDPEFLYYFLTSSVGQDEIYAGRVGSTQPKLPLYNIAKIRIPNLTLDEQKKIADILGTIDEKIELNRRMNETLEQMGQALFRHYFIDNPEAEKWEDGTVADLGKVITGKTPSKSKAEYYGGDVMFLKVPDMHGQSIIIKTEDMLSSLGADSQGNKYIPKWSICVSCIATVGVVSLAGRQLQTNQQINSIVPKNRSYALFNYYLLKSKSETLKTMASGGSATPNLNKGHFERIKIKVPPIELLGRFQNESENLLHTVDENTHQIQTLTTLRDTLLPRLISGKVKI